MSEVLLIFIGLSIFNVMLSTVKSILTVKGGKLIAAITSGTYYGFYNIMIIFTVMDFPMWQKVAITFGCNVIGVYAVKLIEEKMQHDKMWLVKVTIPTINFNNIYKEIKIADISCTCYPLQKYYVIDCYCNTQKETQQIVNLCKKYKGKLFATEAKLNL